MLRQRSLPPTGLRPPNGNCYMDQLPAFAPPGPVADGWLDD
jgi:hypothetical protein